MKAAQRRTPQPLGSLAVAAVTSLESSCGRLIPALPSLLLISLLAAERSPAEPPLDDWPRYAHDGALTGRSPLSGDLTSHGGRGPRTAWSVQTAGTVFVLEVLPDAEGGSLEVRADASSARPESVLDPARFDARWDLGPARRDLDGSGELRPAPESYHERWAEMVPESSGLERIAWSHTWTTAAICRLQLFAHDGGADSPRVVWASDPPEGNIFSPLNVVCDVDRDGIQEVCVAAHYRVMVFEGTTGRKETELRYHECRPYGWFGVLDVDADGVEELVTIGDFQSHIDVLELDASRPEAERLSVKWRRDLETDISIRERWPQVGPRPVANVTGDARLEIVLSMFNETGDGEWHVRVIDASTGGGLLDLPRRFLHAMDDLDGDGREELLVSQTTGVVVPRYGLVEIVRVDAGGPSDAVAPVVIGSEAEGRWATADLPRQDSGWATTALEGMRRALTATPAGGLEGKRARATWLLFRRQKEASGELPHPSVELVAWELGPDGRPRERWRLCGLPERAEARAFVADPAPRALVEVTLPRGGAAHLDGRGARPVTVALRSEGGRPSPPIAARLDPRALPTIVVEAPGNRVVAIDPPSGPPRHENADVDATEFASAPALRFQVPGRGMTNGSRWLGLAAADLDGDGTREVLAADESPDGCACIVAYRSDGTTLWTARIAGTPGPAPVWNRGGLTFWWPGRFREPEKIDVFVSVRRGFMHSDAGILLDGRTGAPLWREETARRDGEFRWGYAGSTVAVSDLDADDLDEIVNLYPVCFWVADGRTGDLVAARDLASRKRLPAWAAYGDPMTADFTGDGAPDVLLDSLYILALLDRSGDPIWHGLPRADYPSGRPEDHIGETTETKHALADLDGDGIFEIASAGYADGVRAIDPATGKRLWSLAAPAPTAERVVAANVDGRGGDEILFPAGEALVAVTGDRTRGSILWTWKGPAALGIPAIADVDSDGKCEIVVRSADGAVHCLDGD